MLPVSSVGSLTSRGRISKSFHICRSSYGKNTFCKDCINYAFANLISQTGHSRCMGTQGGRKGSRTEFLCVWRSDTRDMC